MRDRGIAMLTGCEKPSKPGSVHVASLTNEPGNVSAPAPPMRNCPSSFNPSSFATSVSTMPTLSPVSNTNESGRESFILTLTTMCRVTNSNGIVTGALLAAGAVVCAPHRLAPTSANRRKRNGGRVFRFILIWIEFTRQTLFLNAWRQGKFQKKGDAAEESSVSLLAGVHERY